MPEVTFNLQLDTDCIPIDYKRGTHASAHHIHRKSFNEFLCCRCGKKFDRQEVMKGQFSKPGRGHTHA